MAVSRRVGSGWFGEWSCGKFPPSTYFNHDSFYWFLFGSPVWSPCFRAGKASLCLPELDCFQLGKPRVLRRWLAIVFFLPSDAPAPDGHPIICLIELVRMEPAPTTSFLIKVPKNVARKRVVAQRPRTAEESLAGEIKGKSSQQESLKEPT